MACGYADATRGRDTSARIGGIQGIDDDVEQNTLHLISVQGGHENGWQKLQIQDS
jgi:hypothetical protein